MKQWDAKLHKMTFYAVDFVLVQSFLDQYIVLRLLCFPPDSRKRDSKSI